MKKSNMIGSDVLPLVLTIQVNTIGKKLRSHSDYKNCLGYQLNLRTELSLNLPTSTELGNCKKSENGI